MHLLPRKLTYSPRFLRDTAITLAETPVHQHRILHRDATFLRGVEHRPGLAPQRGDFRVHRKDVRVVCTELCALRRARGSLSVAVDNARRYYNHRAASSAAPSRANYGSATAAAAAAAACICVDRSWFARCGCRLHQPPRWSRYGIVHNASTQRRRRLRSGRSLLRCGGRAPVDVVHRPSPQLRKAK